MKRNINKKSKRNLGRRALSLVLSFVMVVCALHIDYIVEDDKSIIAPMTVYAASEAEASAGLEQGHGDPGTGGAY